MRRGIRPLDIRKKEISTKKEKKLLGNEKLEQNILF